MIVVATVGMFAAMTLALGLLLAFTPYLMRRNECFAVTVPASAQKDPRLVALKKRYATAMVALTAACTIAAIAAGVLMAQGAEQADSAASGIGIALMCAALFVPAIASFALLLVFRKRVTAIKKAEGWAAEHRTRTAIVGEDDVPGAISLAWNLLYVVIVLFTTALGCALYPSMPDLIPMHGDFAGNVDSYADKSIGSVFGFPLLMEAFFALIFFGCHAIMLRSKRPTDPGAPATSALAYGLFVRAESIFLLAVGVVISAGIGVGFMLSAAGVITLMQMGLAMIIVGILVVIGSVAISLVYGQAGSRLFRRMQGDDYLSDDDDEHWKLGIFYCNRDDASIFLPERFGIGWTINFARPAAWILIGCFIAMDIIVVAAIALLA